MEVAGSGPSGPGSLRSAFASGTRYKYNAYGRQAIVTPSVAQGRLPAMLHGISAAMRMALFSRGIAMSCLRA